MLFDFDGTLVDTESIDLRTWTRGLRGARRRGAARPLRAADRNAHGAERARRAGCAARGAVRPRGGHGDAAAPRARAARARAAAAGRARAPRGRARARPARRPSCRAARARGSTRTSSGSASSDGWAAVVCADGDTTRCKPSPALYLEALELLGVRADEAIAVEDSPNGIAAARAAGIFCVGFPNDVTSALDLSARGSRRSSRSRTSRSPTCSSALLLHECDRRVAVVVPPLGWR